MIGLGSIGERHARCFQATGRASVFGVEPVRERREEVACRLNLSDVYDSLDEALRESPEIAVVATPAPSHVSIANKIVLANLHVLIEKPLGVNLEGIERLQEEVDRRSLTAGVAYVCRCHPVFAAWREALATGRFGGLLQLVAVSGQHFPTYRPAYRTIYYNDRRTGGGAVQDALTHLLNAGEWVAGPIDRLVADVSHQGLDGVTVEDTAHLLARHGKVMASYSLNQYQAPNEISLTAVCESGTVRAEPHAGCWRWQTEPGGGWNDEPLGPVERDTPFIEQAHRFLDAVEGRGLIPCSLAEGLQTLRVNMEALASAESGTWRILS